MSVPIRWRRWPVIALAVVAALLVIGRVSAGIVADYLWYASMGAAALWRERAMLITMICAGSALVAAAIAPGLAPFVGARVGVGNNFEGGLTYTCRSVRVDRRRGFDDGKGTLAPGLGAPAEPFGLRQANDDRPPVPQGHLPAYAPAIPTPTGKWQSA